MLLVQLSILMVWVLVQSYLKPPYITYTLLCCLYFIHTKHYKLLFFTGFILIVVEFDQSNFDQRYKKGNRFDFSVLTSDLSIPVNGFQSYSISYSLNNMVIKNSFSLLQNKLLVHIPLNFFDGYLSEKKGRLTGQAIIEKIIYADVKGSWLQQYLFRQYIVAELWLVNPSNVNWQARPSAKKPIPNRVRLALDQTYDMFPSWRFSQSLFLGDKSKLTNKDFWLVRFLGLSHLFVVSGLHIGFVYLLLTHLVNGIWRFSPSFLIQTFQKQHLLQLFLVFPCVLFYGYLTGWGEPVQRAVIMLFVWQWAKHLHIKLSAFNALFAALLIICLLTPRAILAPGLWLSFCLVFLLVCYFKDRKACWLDWFKVQLMLTIGATSLTLGWQSSLSIISVLVNLIMVPFTAFIWFPIMLFASIETVLLGSTVLMFSLDSILYYLLSFLEYIAFHSFSVELAQYVPFIIKLLLFSLVIVWILYERSKISAYLLLLLIVLFLLKEPVSIVLKQSDFLAHNVWYVRNKENNIGLYNGQGDLLVDTGWANHPTELINYQLDLTALTKLNKSEINVIVETQIKQNIARIFIWPFSNNLITAKLMQKLAPTWLLLKEVPSNEVTALLSALSIDWLLVTKKQTIKIEFWQNYWYIKHSNCLIFINSQQENDCQRVAQLESVVN